MPNQKPQPVAVGLGMLAQWPCGYPLGFNPLMGTAGLIGVAINGSIVVLAAIRADARAKAGEPEAITEVTVASTRHILSTTCTTVGGFLPLIAGGGAFWPPLAIVIGGGVALSTTLALVFTPAAYRLLTRYPLRIDTQSTSREYGTMTGLPAPATARADIG